MPPHVDVFNSGLEGLIEEHTKRLTRILERGSLSEFADEVNSLNDLINSYAVRDELLERLLDVTTPAERRKRILETLKQQKLLVAANRAEMARLHGKSHSLIKRSILLITKAQRLIHREKAEHSSYALEICGFCEGFGGSAETPCPACHGKRNVLVHQPPIKCPRCEGNGKPKRGSYIEVCLVCRGFGWAMTADLE